MEQAIRKCDRLDQERRKAGPVLIWQCCQGMRDEADIRRLSEQPLTSTPAWPNPPAPALNPGSHPAHPPVQSVLDRTPRRSPALVIDVFGLLPGARGVDIKNKVATTDIGDGTKDHQAWSEDAIQQILRQELPAFSLRGIIQVCRWA